MTTSQANKIRLINYIGSKNRRLVPQLLCKSRMHARSQFRTLDPLVSEARAPTTYNHITQRPFSGFFQTTCFVKYCSSTTDFSTDGVVVVVVA